jgi:uncharacterized membrane protein
MAVPPPQAPPPPPPPPPGRRGGFLPGLGLSLLLHFLQLPLWIVAGVALFAVQALTSGGQGQENLFLYVSIAAGVCLLLIGLSQLVYMVPALVIARRRGRADLVQGLAIGLAVTFLLNAGCWGLFGAASVFG